jgi:uncharacterized metal-binding protein YceD (DUF177 family)
MARPAPAPEFSRMVDVPRVAGRVARHAIAADDQERAALAQRFGLVALDRLEAELRIELLRGGMVRIEAALAADLTQECVVTLEPVPAKIEESFALLYGPPEAAREVVIDGEAETVEPLEGARIDVGEAVAQQLSLALDPFPRAPGATL